MHAHACSWQEMLTNPPIPGSIPANSVNLGTLSDSSKSAFMEIPTAYGTASMRNAYGSYMQNPVQELYTSQPASRFSYSFPSQYSNSSTHFPQNLSGMANIGSYYNSAAAAAVREGEMAYHRYHHYHNHYHF